MGTLGAHDIQRLINLYRLDTFVETGTAGGDSLEHAARFPFVELHSVDISERYCSIARTRMGNDNRVQIQCSDSVRFLERLLPALIESKILFWLDAHCPEDQISRDDKRYFPLEEELRIIARFRERSEDVILIDDLRIYRDGPFEGGNWSDRPRLSGDFGTDSVRDMFGLTHTIEEDFRDEGYLIVAPFN